MPYWDKIKKKWIAQIKVNGKKYRSLQESKSNAKTWEVKKREEMERYVRSSQIPTLCLLDFANQYLDFSKMKFTKLTYKEKKRAFRLLFKSVDSSLAVQELHKGAVLAHLQEQASNRSGYAANKDRKNLVASWNWAIKYIPDFPGKNPFLIDRFPEVRSPRYIPPEKDFWKVYDVAESPQDKALLLCFLHLAARRGEIFNLRRKDVDLKRKQVRLFTRKRKDGSLDFDWLPLTVRLFSTLSRILKSHCSEWVFPNPRIDIPYRHRSKWMPRLCSLAGVPAFGVHAIRHLSASILISNGVSLFDVQTILRHKNLSTTEKYIHRLESVRAAMEVFK